MADIFSAATKVFGKSMEVASDMFDKSVDAASDIIDKGKDAAGGFANSANEVVSKSRTKAKLYDQGLEYDKLMLQLGKAVYERVKDDETYVSGNEELFAKIAASVERRQILEDELAEIEAKADAAKPVDVDATSTAQAEVVEAEVVDVEADAQPEAEEKAE